MAARTRLLAICFALASLGAPGSGADETEPIDPGIVETVESRLGLIDVVVLDRAGEPVGGLDRDDFDLTIDGEPVPIETFDVSCPGEPPSGRLVFAFDYQHLSHAGRERAFEIARRAVARGATADQNVMVVGLTGTLRLESSFSNDSDVVLAALGAMRDDRTLWAGNFAHADEKGFVRGLTSLFDVLGTYPQAKAVVLFSAMQDVPFETQFREIAARAATSRTRLFPVDVRGLVAPGRSEIVSGPREVDPGSPPLASRPGENTPDPSARFLDRLARVRNRSTADVAAEASSIGCG